nr:uncharacterized protein LOC107278490 [Oryza sativa Japonica Group]
MGTWGPTDARARGAQGGDPAAGRQPHRRPPRRGPLARALQDALRPQVRLLAVAPRHLPPRLRPPPPSLPPPRRHRRILRPLRRPLFLDPSLHFLPRCRALDLLDSCNGLLCRCWRISDYRRRFDYLVVNHATRQWVVLPESARSDKRQIAYLGFDPAVSSSHFHVFELVEKNPANADGEADDGELDATINALEIYSSETGVWSHKDIGWGHQIGVLDDWRSVFFNGMLHLITMGYVVAVVDVEGNSWRTIPMPQTLDDPDCNVDDGTTAVISGP